MEKKGKQIILNCEKLERRFALLNNGRLEEYQIERDDHEPKVGDIYLGRIINLEPSLQAAFVDIGAEKNAFLHYHEMLPGCGEMLERRGEQDSDSDEEEPGEESIQARRRKRRRQQRKNRRRVFAPGRKVYFPAFLPKGSFICSPAVRHVPRLLPKAVFPLSEIPPANR